jgi:hypothetical protein
LVARDNTLQILYLSDNFRYFVVSAYDLVVQVGAIDEIYYSDKISKIVIWIARRMAAYCDLKQDKFSTRGRW